MLGKKIKHGRLLKDMRQKDLAEKVGVHVLTIGSWERGESSPTMIDMARLKKILGLNVDEILEKMINEEESEVADEVKKID